MLVRVLVGLLVSLSTPAILLRVTGTVSSVLEKAARDVPAFVSVVAESLLRPVTIPVPVKGHLILMACFVYRFGGGSSKLSAWLGGLWNLWKSRNKLVFENRVFYSLRNSTEEYILDAKEWGKAQLSPNLNVEPLDLTVLHSRHSPIPSPHFAPGILVCNVDAAWNANSCECAVGVFSRNNHMRIPNLCESRICVSSALMAEAIVVRLAIVTAVYSNV
ncbi:hypothetical protein N665_0008s0047 [Sinapis alba]|nr:hypothetical protein N665_0008s0047 [Sinapis alba]